MPINKELADALRIIAEAQQSVLAAVQAPRKTQVVRDPATGRIIEAVSVAEQQEEITPNG